MLPGHFVDTEFAEAADAASEQRKKRFLRLACAIIAASSLVYLLAMPWLARGTPIRALAPSLFLLVCGITEVLPRRVRAQTAGLLFSYGLLLSVLLVGILSGGIRTTSVYALPILVGMGGWLVGTRHAFAIAALAIAATLGISLAEQRQLLPPAAAPRLFSIWLGLAILLTIAAILSRIAVRAFQAQLDQADRLGESLARRVQDLASEQAQLRLVAENVPAMIVHMDGSQRCVYANAQYAAFFGLTPEDIVGRHATDVIGERAYAEIRGYLDRAIAGERVSYRRTARDCNGRERQLDVSVVPERDERGGTKGYFALIQDISERQRIEADLLTSEHKFAKVFSSSPLPIALTRLSDGRYLDVNQAWVRLHGWSREEAVGRTSLELGTWISTQERQKWIDALASNGHVSGLDVRFGTRGGAPRDVLLSSELIDLAGEPCALVMVVDVTERKRIEAGLREAEAALRASEEWLRLASESAEVGLWEWDVASNAIHWNTELKRIFGFPPERTGMTLDDFTGAIHPDDVEATGQAFGTAMAQHGLYDHEFRFIRSDGSLRWLHARGHAEYDVAGRAFRMMGAGIDITQFKEAEAALVKDRALRETIIREATEGLCVCHAVAEFPFVQFTVWNKRMEEMTGYTMADINRMGWYQSVYPDAELQARAVARMERMRLGEDMAGEEWEITRADGEKRLLRISSRMLELGEEGLHVLALMEDVTLRRQAEAEIHRLNAELESRVRERTAELQAANKELESFAYSISHDLRAPLRGIDGFSHLLAEEYGDKLDAQGRGYLERVRRAAQRMGTLIDDILELSRVSRLGMRRAPVDLSELAREILDERSRAAPKQAAHLVIAADCVAFGDPQLLRVLLQNLLENAWKYSSREAAPRIEFGCAMEDGECVFHVRDNGVGFDMQYAGRLFTPFQRLHGAEAFEGTGIGLATVARVVNRHGGRVWAESAVGQGATFRFTLGPAAHVSQ